MSTQIVAASPLSRSQRKTTAGPNDPFTVAETTLWWGLVSTYLRRIPRRAVSIIVVIVALLGVFAFWPVILVGTLIHDALRDWRRHRATRVFLMISALLLNEAFGLLSLLLAWVLCGFGLGTHSAASYRMLGAIHGQWTHNINRATELFLDTKITVVGRECLEPAPVIAIQRHISLLDAVLPSKLVAYRKPNAPRHIMMQELCGDPCIETLGHRTPNHFVDRSAGGPKELAAIEAVGRTIDVSGSGVIFPEGGFRTEPRYERALESLAERDPDLAERAKNYRHVMPPRPGGTRALLAGAPGVDVVVIAHVGFEGFSTIKDIMSNAPIGRPINVELKRIARDQIPTDEAAFAHWLFDQYDWIDAFVESHLAVDVRDDEVIDVDRADGELITGERESVG